MKRARSNGDDERTERRAPSRKRASHSASSSTYGQAYRRQHPPIPRNIPYGTQYSRPGVNYFDTSHTGPVQDSSANPATSWRFDPNSPLSCLFSPAVGNGPTDRGNARAVRVTSIYVRGVVDFPQSEQAGFDTPDARTAGLWLVLNKNANGVQLDPTDVLHSISPAVLQGAPYAIRNMARAKNFKVLKHWTFKEDCKAMVAYSTSATAYNTGIFGSTQEFEFFKKTDLLFNFSADTSGVGSMEDLSLHMVATAGVPGLTPPIIRYHIRCMFEMV